MHRRLGVDILEGQTQLVFIDYLGRDFAVDDPPENGFVHGVLILVGFRYAFFC
jgi:hypothetical protein